MMENRVTIKSDGITFEGLSASLFVAGLFTLAGLLIFKPPIVKEQPQRYLTNIDVVPKIEGK